jgi:hypothetical protein
MHSISSAALFNFLSLRIVTLAETIRQGMFNAQQIDLPFEVAKMTRETNS